MEGMKPQMEIIEKILGTLTEEEMALKQFFWQHHRIATAEEAERISKPVLPTHPLSIWNNKGMHDKENRTSSFSEQHFFPPTVDVFFMKHACYSNVMLHRHEFYEICYVHRGDCRHTLITDQEKQEETVIRLREGDFLFISPGQTHTALVDTDSVVLNIGVRKSTFYQSFYNQIPNDTILDKFFYQQMKNEEGKGYLLFQTGTSQPVWESYCCFIADYMDPGAFVEKLLNLRLGIMFIQILKQFSYDTIARSQKSTGKTLVPAIISYLQEHYSETNIADTARTFGYSSDYMNKLFKEVTGSTLLQTLTQIRMLEAKKLLLYEDLSIAEVSELVGYMDVTNFIRNFKKTYHCSPGKFRQSVNAKDT